VHKATRPWHGWSRRASDIPISASALISGVALLFGMLAGLLQMLDARGAGGGIVGVVAVARGVVGLLKSRATAERVFGALALLTGLVGLGLLIFRESVVA
jgi:hypothetical protein